MIIRNFVFYDATSTNQVSNYLSNPGETTALTLQVQSLDGGSSDFEFKIEGMTDLTNPDEYFPIQAVGLEDFNTHDVINSEGLYMVIVDGVQRIRCNSTEPVGNIKVTAVGVG